ncbi:MAG TPA: TQO small subunit DoxD [Ktedonobacteraceae bacterium]|nr:TQO small subunit DoxD [Ktedonobacteraceae bacterium]
MSQRTGKTLPGKGSYDTRKESPYRQREAIQPPRQPLLTEPEPVSWKASWFMLPLRLFLGITFVYAGIQKLTDPQYFNPAARGYIGKQIIAFATGSPLHYFLIRFAVPHAHLFGAMVAYGEVAIGLGTLIGLLFRPAAFFGLLLSITFFLTATWHVYPYFYGADIVFIFCWITVILAGPLHTGLPALDAFLVPRLLKALPAEERATLALPVFFLLGVRDTTEQSAPTSQQQNRYGSQHPVAARGKYAAARYAQRSRRSFLYGLITGGAAILGLVFVGSHLHGDDGSAATGTTTAGNSASATAGGTPGTNTIAQVSAVPTNSAVTFTIPSNNDPGILIHLENGQFVAYDATCTHAGCPVNYDPSQQLLVCPCHGAEFDPAKNGAVVQPPAQQPLTSVTIHIDSSTGAITL